MLLNSFLPLRRKTTAAYPWLISKALLFSRSHMGDGSGSLNATASLEAGKMQTGSDTQQECCMTSACSSLAYRTRNTARFKATTGTTYYDAHDYSSCLAARQNSHRQSKSLVCMSLDSPVMHTEARWRAAPTMVPHVHPYRKQSMPFMTPQKGKMTHVRSSLPFS